MISLYKDNDKLIKSTLKQFYDKTLDVSISHSIVPVKKKIDPTRVIEREVAGRIWTERTKHYGNNFVYDVHSIIKEGLSRGDTYTTMAKNLENRFGKEIGNTVRIARTEGARVLEDTKFNTFEEINKSPNIKVVKVWHTMSDERVRDTHQAMEGVEVDFDKEFTLPSGATCMYPKASGVPSEDINCRCYCEYKTIVKENIENKVPNYEVGNFFDATNEWKEVTKEKSKIVKDLKTYKYNGFEFKVDNKHVVLDYSKHEKEVADVIANKYGKEVFMVPRVLYPLGISTPDYLIDGEKWDLKVVNSRGENAFYNALRKNKKQADRFIIELQNFYDEKWLNRQIDSIAQSSHYKNIKEIMIYVEREIIKAVKRK